MYLDQLGIGQLLPATAASVAPLTLSGTPAGQEHVCIGGQVEIRRVAVVVTTAINSTGAVVITVRNRPVCASNAVQPAITTLTIPSSATAGQVYYKDINQAVVVPGGSLFFDVTTAATTGGAAICGYIAQEDPEQPSNVLTSGGLPKMILSA